MLEVGDDCIFFPPPACHQNACTCHELYCYALAADDNALKAHFDKAASAAGGALRSAAVSRKKEKGPDGQPLSKGFGFVECSSEAAAKGVLKQLQVRLRLRPQIWSRVRHHNGAVDVDSVYRCIGTVSRDGDWTCLRLNPESCLQENNLEP